MISVSWMDLTFIEEVDIAQFSLPKLINHREELENKLTEIGLDFALGDKTIRVFGYASRIREQFQN